MLNAIVDLHAPEGVESWAKVRDAGIAAVIHKATEGQDFTDAKYETRRAAAPQAGLLWGSYHFGTASDPEKQAKHFLSVVNPGPNDLIVLDLEENEKNPHNSMSIKQAVTFLSIVHDETGRWPGLYAGADLRDMLNGHGHPILSNCWLWLAHWHDEPKLIPGWDNWTLWQYTDGIQGPEPHTIPGIGVCDRSKFNGDLAGLQKLFGAA
jgi:lysozyme